MDKLDKLVGALFVLVAGLVVWFAVTKDIELRKCKQAQDHEYRLRQLELSPRAQP